MRPEPDVLKRLEDQFLWFLSAKFVSVWRPARGLMEWGVGYKTLSAINFDSDLLLEMFLG